MVEEEKKNNNKLKIEKKKLRVFFEETKMNSLDSCLLEFQDNGLKISAMSKDNISFVSAFLKKEAFEDYNAIGNIGVDGVEYFVTILKRFNKLINIEIQGNQCLIEDNKKSVKFPLVEEDFIEKPDNIPENLSFDIIKKINVKEIKDFIKDIKINRDFAFGFKTLNNKLHFYNTGKYKFDKSFDIKEEEKTKNIEVKFGEPLIRALESFESEGEISLNLKTDYPIKIERNTEDYDIIIYIAPRVDND